MISDHRTKSIVLAVRGSISLRDIFTDLVAAPEKIDVEGLPEGSMVNPRTYKDGIVCLCNNF